MGYTGDVVRLPVSVRGVVTTMKKPTQMFVIILLNRSNGKDAKRRLIIQAEDIHVATFRGMKACHCGERVVQISEGGYQP